MILNNQSAWLRFISHELIFKKTNMFKIEKLGSKGCESKFQSIGLGKNIRLFVYPIKKLNGGKNHHPVLS